jgi:hypothetical protein
MKCPYCLSAVDDEAVVCKVCTKDLYLFKSLMAKIHQLENQLDALKDHPALVARVTELEGLLEAERSKEEAVPETVGRVVFNAVRFVLAPLILLLVAHALITIVYDLNVLYLRVVSLVLPWPFAFYLFKARDRAYSPWIAMSGVMAVASVIGMSAITSSVDHTPVLPQNMLEWREFFEYATSITLSFITGMVVGGMAYNRAHQASVNAQNALLRRLVQGAGGGKLSPDALHGVMKKLNDFGSSIVALGATGASIYTGLKAVM